MHDMDAFDRQIAREVLGTVRPPRQVDHLAIFTAITATQSGSRRFQSLFSATKFVVAGAIVALFGGFLLSGVLTQQPSDDRPPAVGASASVTTQAEPTDAATSEPEPSAEAEGDTTTTPDLLPGVDLVTEEVEPAVYQVLGDGLRELSRDADDQDAWLRGILHGNIVAGHDGSVWWLGPDGFFRIGDRTEHEWPEPADEFGVDASDDFAVTPDGTLWRSRPGYPSTNAASFDGVGWTEHREEWRGDGIEVQEDGTVWVLRNIRNERNRVARLTEGGWATLPGSIRRADSGGGWALAVSYEGGDAWLVGREGLHRHDGDGWQRQSSPFGNQEVRRADVGPDGTLWARFGDHADPKLARFDGDAWQAFTDGVPRMGDHYQGFEGWFEVAPDGSVWFNPDGDYEVTGTECDGVANFDGERLARFLRDTCVYGMDVAPDGDVWLLAGPSPDSLPNSVHTYVITPRP